MVPSVSVVQNICILSLWLSMVSPYFLWLFATDAGRTTSAFTSCPYKGGYIS